MKKFPCIIPIRIALAALCLFGALTASHAAVLTYYRFESTPGFLNDSSGNGFNLTGNATSNTSLVNIPTVIPQTGASNAQLAQILSDRSLQTADRASFNSTTFTLEAYGRNFDNNFHVMASQSDIPANQVGWRFGLNLGADRLVLSLSSNGTVSGYTNFETPFVIAPNEDFYIAATVNITGSGTTVVFYYDNLTNLTPLANATVTSATFTSLHNSTANLVLGGELGTGGTIVSDWNGRIDEFRFSNTVLSQSQLLAVPEPSAFVLVAGALLLLGAVRRRRNMQPCK